MSSPKVLTPEEVASLSDWADTRSLSGYCLTCGRGRGAAHAATCPKVLTNRLLTERASTRRAALDEAADYVRSCREDDKGYRVVQVFDVLAKHLHEAAEGKRQLRDTTRPKETP